MGVCCSNRPVNDDLIDEIRKDAKIVDFNTRDSEDLIKSLTSQGTKEKIIFEVKDNPLENYSKAVFQKFNELRTNPIGFYSQPDVERDDAIIDKITKNHQKPNLFSWSTKKSRLISDFFQSPKNSFKSNTQKINEIKEKYSNDFILYTFSSKGSLGNTNECLLNLIKNSKESELNKLLLDSFAYCVIYSENFEQFNNEASDPNVKIISYIFLFKLIQY